MVYWGCSLETPYGLNLNDKITRMIIRLVKLTFKQNHVDEFLELFDVAKEKILSFEGCIGIELLRDLEHPNVFFTHSVWKTDEHLQEYRSSKIFGKYWVAVKKMFLTKAEAWSTDSIYKIQ